MNPILVIFVLPLACRGWCGPTDKDGRPLIQKLGTVDLDLVETTPVVFKDRLWRFEWVREDYWNNLRKTNYFRFRDVKTGDVSAPFADGHEFGSAFVYEREGFRHWNTEAEQGEHVRLFRPPNVADVAGNFR